MMPYIVRDYRPDDPQDAERLAAMFNDFDSAWPGGFTRGLRETADRVRERKRLNRRLAVCVVECDGEIVGYGDLDAQPGHSDVAYLPLLGARLSHHGKGVGKMLLREIIRRTTELGYRQLTLDTWAGNLKAVPLYKKTGFQWQPETSVYMRNFIPTALTIPAGKAFFANRDWYDCFDRELKVAPDNVKWNGMKVYAYRFRDGDDFLNLMIDAAAEGVTALETPEYAAACILGMEETPAGETFPVVWEIEPRGNEPLEVLLLAEGEPGLELKVQERLLVKEKTRIERTLRVSPDATPRRGGETAHRIHSTLLINGQPLQLETGAKVVRPVEIQYHGQGLFPGREEKVLVRLRNRLDRPVEAELAWDANPALSLSPPAQPFHLPPKSWTQCEFRVTAKESGNHLTALRFNAGDTRGTRSIAFRAFSGETPQISIDTVDDESAVIETPSLHARMRLRGGGLNLQQTGAGRHFIWQNLAELGPPFLEFRSRQPLQTAREEQTTDGKSLVLRVPSVEHPGLMVERAVAFLGSDVMKVDYRVLNTTGSPLPSKLRLQSGPGMGGFVIHPTEAGLIREPLRSWEDYPDNLTDALAKGAKYKESWVALEEDELVCGIIWTGNPEEADEWNRFPDLTYDLGEIPAHGSFDVPPVYLVGGGGNWKTVRSWWKRLTQPAEFEEESDPEPIRVLEAAFDPSPALLTEDEEEVTVTLNNRRGQVVSGCLTLSGGNLAKDKDQFPFEEVNRDRPFSATVRMSAPASPQAAFVTAEADTGPRTETFRLPFLRLSTPGEVKLSSGEDGQIGIENGWMTLKVAPEFLGSLTTLERHGVNHLLSPFPEPQPFVWFNPWHGGVHPFVGGIGNERFIRSRFTGETTERTGERGLRWTGAKVICEPEHKDLRWLRLEVEYLTLPGSNVVAILTRWINRTDARTDAHGGINSWLQVGGDRESAVLHWERNGERRHRRRGGFQATNQSGPWAAVENTRTGEAVALVTSDPRAHATTVTFQEEGPHFEGSGSVRLGPNETKETLTWLALCSSMDQVEAYAALSKVRRLP